MRLINVHNRRLHEFYDAETPDYAILSHTWGDDEVTFDDLSNNRGQDKTAYRKIRFLCNQALEDALDWAWLDTCCINKDSSAELSEAINSMYRWYHRARCCYAYLGDIGPEILWGSHTHTLTDSKGRSQLAASKWFTRGWTLQELLAPQTTKFYGPKWNYIGDRDSLAPILAGIARIRESVLKDPAAQVSQCSVAEKMSWAATRQTSRIEDKAYCLLGIFEVNMPMLYGEGERAFLRLQEEIIRSTDDHSIFVWRPHLPGDRNLLLAPSPDRFIEGDRIVKIQKLHHMDGHSFGNTGLRITVPLIKLAPMGCWHAILGCRYRDDFQKIIVLCMRSRVSEDVVPSTLYVSPTIAPQQRFLEQKAPQRIEDLPPSRTVIINRTMPEAETTQTAGAKYWFDLQESSKVGIVAAYPPEHFNAHTLSMDLNESQIRYGAVLVSMTESLAASTGYETTSWHSNSLAIVFGGWTAPEWRESAETKHVNRHMLGIFGIVQSNSKNLANACRLAVSRSIYRSREADQNHVAWVRSVCTVPWSNDTLLNVTFTGERQIGILGENVNVISVELQRRYESRTTPMPVLKQGNEPDANPLGVERLQDFVRSWTESDVGDERELKNEGPDPDLMYELEGEIGREQLEEESDDEEVAATDWKLRTFTISTITSLRHRRLFS
ncbi:hypothetical protein AMS68_003456 [Peltaster fructicola]|uniref:Uncharacterized protein n=1 Tax=Peltaster fructicola TaxID=286661 RepID=A0A6H0XTJ0_9PEZI|nr:hypothetical protein AMS68_003456 [Peltaster fructicola]